MAADYPLALASSSPPELIEFALAEAGIGQCFGQLVSSDQVRRGKPWPDVFLEAARRLGIAAARLVVFEDSSSGIQAAHDAGMRVIAVPNPHYPPSDEALALANLVLGSLESFESSSLASLWSSWHGSET